MHRIALVTAFTFGALFLFPLLTEGQGLFSRDPNAAIIRKARKYNLVSVEKEIPGIFIDMRYKITSASGKPLYREEMPCLIHKSTAEKLKRVNRQLRANGYALKVWDGWRPPEAHLALWNAVKDPNFVVPPSKGLSWHCYGISIDLTLVRLDGSPVEMPSDFDEFSERASSTYTGNDPEIKKRLDLLQRLMIGEGFRKIQSEWWHFDDMKAQGGIRRVTAADLGIRMP